MDRRTFKSKQRLQSYRDLLAQQAAKARAAKRQSNVDRWYNKYANGPRSGAWG